MIELLHDPAVSAAFAAFAGVLIAKLFAYFLKKAKSFVLKTQTKLDDEALEALEKLAAKYLPK